MKKKLKSVPLLVYPNFKVHFFFNPMQLHVISLLEQSSAKFRKKGKNQFILQVELWQRNTQEWLPLQNHKNRLKTTDMS